MNSERDTAVRTAHILQEQAKKHISLYKKGVRRHKEIIDFIEQYENEEIEILKYIDSLNLEKLRAQKLLSTLPRVSIFRISDYINNKNHVRSLKEKIVQFETAIENNKNRLSSLKEAINSLNSEALTLPGFTLDEELVSYDDYLKLMGKANYVLSKST